MSFVAIFVPAPHTAHNYMPPSPLSTQQSPPVLVFVTPKEPVNLPLCLTWIHRTH